MIRKRKTAEDRQREHKCYKCIWARWDDVEQVFCIFGRCFKVAESAKYKPKI